jgi:hypothetical protein
MLGVANVDLVLLDDGDVHSKTFSTRVQQQMNSVYYSRHRLSRTYNTQAIQRVNLCISESLTISVVCPPQSRCKCLVVSVSTIKVIADLLPEEVAINDWLIFILQNLFGGIVLSPEEAQVFLNAPCSLKRCDFRVEVGLEEKWDAGMICEGMGLKAEIDPLTIH